MSYTEIATARATAETYAGKMSRIAAELLDVLRDALGPQRRLPVPRDDYTRFGGHSVTVRDGADGRVEVTAYLTTSGEVGEYTARITYEDPGPRRQTAVGPARTGCLEAPEVRPTLTHVLPLVVRLEEGERRLQEAEIALRVAGYPVERSGPRLVLREALQWGGQGVAAVELDPDNGALLVHGRDAAQAREVLYQASIF